MGGGGAWSAELVDEAVGVGDAVHEGEEVRQDPLQPLVPHRRVRSGAPRGVGGISKAGRGGGGRFLKRVGKMRVVMQKPFDINHNAKL